MENFLAKNNLLQLHHRIKCMWCRQPFW